MTFNNIEDKLKNIMNKKITENEKTFMWSNINSELKPAGKTNFWLAFKFKYAENYEE